MTSCISIEDEKYPALLREIPKAPNKLFYKGEWRKEIFDKCLAVVGSRRMTGYGKMATENLIYPISASGVTIVSGFMYGVDATAHKVALSCGGSTVAVMPCGIETINPPEQEDLYKQILDSGGLIISEFEGDSQPQLWTYPKRNRIVAGLCKAVLVVEAGLNSGSLITANYAKLFGRKIFSVPGSIFSPNSEGTNHIIDDGASLIMSSEDILTFFDAGYRMPVFESLRSNDELLETLFHEPLGLDDLAEKTGQPVSELNSKITMYLISGQIVEVGGRFYVNKG